MKNNITSLRDIYYPIGSGTQLFYGIARLRDMIAEYPVDIDCDFQRGHVWTTKQKQLFVGHLLEGGQIPSCILNVDPEETLSAAQLVDGKQRMTACIDWCEGVVVAELSDGRFIKYNELDKTSITMCSMTIGLRFIITKMTRKDVLSLYIKLNRGGTVHTEEEINKVKELLKAEQGK
jgi:hypothetical protein